MTTPTTMDDTWLAPDFGALAAPAPRRRRPSRLARVRRLTEGNPNHEPAGSPRGGQFARKPGGASAALSPDTSGPGGYPRWPAGTGGLLPNEVLVRVAPGYHVLEVNGAATIAEGPDNRVVDAFTRAPATDADAAIRLHRARRTLDPEGAAAYQTASPQLAVDAQGHRAGVSPLADYEPGKKPELSAETVEGARATRVTTPNMDDYDRVNSDVWNWPAVRDHEGSHQSIAMNGVESEIAFTSGHMRIAHGPKGRVEGIANVSPMASYFAPSPEPDYLEVHWLATRPGARKGVGARLLAQCAREAADAGLPLVLTPTEVAVPFYKKMGMHWGEIDSAYQSVRKLMLTPEEAAGLADLVLGPRKAK